MKHITCPIVLHPTGTPRRVLVLTHPDTGTHMMRSALKEGEDPTTAASRALFEATGLETSDVLPLGQNGEIAQNENWHFMLCRVTEPVRNEWKHPSADGSDVPVTAQWHELDETPEGMHRHFRRAFAWIQMEL